MSSSLHDRLTQAFARFLKRAVVHALEQVQPCAGQGAKPSSRVRCIDSAVVRRHDTPAQQPPACRTDHAQASTKLHVVLNVPGHGVRPVKVTAERVDGSTGLCTGRWVTRKQGSWGRPDR